MPWKNIFLVALGGSIGAVARFLSFKLITNLFPPPFPWGTFIINITGCFLIGVFYSLSVKHMYFTPELRLLLMTGLCGGFTTFSAFTLEGMGLLNEQRVLTFLLYFATSVVVGLGATFLGYWISKLFF